MHAVSLLKFRIFILIGLANLLLILSSPEIKAPECMAKCIRANALLIIISGEHPPIREWLN